MELTGPPPSQRWLHSGGPRSRLLFPDEHPIHAHAHAHTLTQTHTHTMHNTLTYWHNVHTHTLHSHTYAHLLVKQAPGEGVLGTHQPFPSDIKQEQVSPDLDSSVLACFSSLLSLNNNSEFNFHFRLLGIITPWECRMPAKRFWASTSSNSVNPDSAL